MGMSASQARFLQLTARKSNVEYQAQRINFERLQLAEQQNAVSAKYNDAMSNRKLVFSYNTGEGVESVDITYKNYKNYMNQQLDDLSTSQQKMFLVSTSGNKIVVANEEDMKRIIDDNTTRYSGTKEQILSAKDEYEKAQAEKKPVSAKIKALASIELPEEENTNSNTVSDSEETKETAAKEYSITVNDFEASDFVIADDLDNTDNFQKALMEGVYFFATYGIQEGDNDAKFKTVGIDSTNSISEQYDRTDDAAAQAEYDTAMHKIQSQDKKLELELNRLNTEREAITTEMESVQKVLDDNIESTFKVFS